MTMVVACPDDLVTATHPVRLVMAVVEKLDLRRFHEPIKARHGVAGRDATAPELPVALWLYACIRGIGSARELARRCGESAPFVRPAWAHSYGCKSRQKLVTVSEVKRNCMRATDCGEEAWIETAGR